MESSRQNLTKIALEAYRSLKHNRAYALTDDAKNVLTIIAAAVLQKRAAEGRINADNPTQREEIAGLIQKLADASCNLLQRRPTDEQAIPKPWLNPVTGQTNCAVCCQM